MVAYVMALALAAADPDPSSIIMLDGTAVTVAQLKVLNDAFFEVKTSDVIDVNVLAKPPSAMPSYDPLWHYAGSTVGPSGHITSVVWITKTPQDAHAALVEVAAGILLAVMDSGFAGTSWKSFYDKEVQKDKADLARTGNPFAHRDAVALRLALAMYSASQ